jgi:hypothetical protein
MKKSFLTLSILATTLAAQSASAAVIGYFDDSRELFGFAGNNYISKARQWLVDQGHTLIATNNANAAFLSSVDAFYSGLISSISADEIAAMENFVNVDGGFLFIQQDHDLGGWHAPSSQILSNWGIGNSAGTFSNDSGHTTVGSSSWVTTPNLVSGFIGADHSTINVIPNGFEVLARDDQGRAIMGVFDAGAGRSSDVFVATDINFWDDTYGWSDSRNRQLWQNIWTVAARETTGDVPEPTTLGLFGLALGGLGLVRRRNQKQA